MRTEYTLFVITLTYASQFRPQLVVDGKHLLLISKVPSSSLGPNIGYRDKIFVVSFILLGKKSGILN
jgi:hypothetical protein